MGSSFSRCCNSLLPWALLVPGEHSCSLFDILHSRKTCCPSNQQKQQLTDFSIRNSVSVNTPTEPKNLFSMGNVWALALRHIIWSRTAVPSVHTRADIEVLELPFQGCPRNALPFWPQFGWLRYCRCVIRTYMCITYIHTIDHYPYM